jgi:predicted DNA-binding transcriptional regulator AlpA
MQPSYSPTSTSSDDCLLTEDEVAQRLSVSVRTLQGWRVRGGGPHFVKLGNGRAVRYRATDIRDYVAARVARSTSDTPNAA